MTETMSLIASTLISNVDAVDANVDAIRMAAAHAKGPEGITVEPSLGDCSADVSPKTESDPSRRL